MDTVGRRGPDITRFPRERCLIREITVSRHFLSFVQRRMLTGDISHCVEKESMDLDTWETLVNQQACASVSWHVFEKDPPRVYVSSSLCFAREY